MCNHLQGDEISKMMCRIEDSVKESLEGDVQVTDPMGNGHHFEVHVTSEKFEGLPLVKQHRMVLDTLKELLSEDLHSVVVKTTDTGSSFCTIS